MPKKCRTCGYRIIEYPLYKGQEEGVPFLKGDTPEDKWKSLFSKETWNRQWIWKNVFIGDWSKALILISLLFLAWAYSHDTAVVKKIYANPCGFVMKNYQACYAARQQQEMLNITAMNINFTFDAQPRFN